MIYRMKKLLLLLLALPVLMLAQPKAGYYDAAVGKSDAALKTQIYTIISDHTERSYSNLWTDFQSTDKRADGKVWDMYSNCNFIFGTDQDPGSDGGSECQYYNREHSFPKSWFKDGTPMYTDLFHLYPTDKYVNNERGNLPYGETGSKISFSNGVVKVGYSSYPGYSNIVFEPANEYKGDFARDYMYMVTCYEDYATNWRSTGTTSMLSNNSYPVFKPYAINLLLEWSRNDPVSEKEINRNNAVYKLQGNRNPYVDFPILSEYVWGKHKDLAWNGDNSDPGKENVFYVSYNSETHSVFVKTDDPESSRFYIYNTSGVLLMHAASMNGESSIDVSGLEKGIYIIKNYSGTRRNVGKFVVN